jgi:hypothetical protein
MFLVLRVAAPLFGEAYGPGKPNAAVDYQNSSMRPPVGAIDPLGMSGMIVGEFATRLPHHPLVGVI